MYIWIITVRRFSSWNRKGIFYPRCRRESKSEFGFIAVTHSPSTTCCSVVKRGYRCGDGWCRRGMVYVLVRKLRTRRGYLQIAQAKGRKDEGKKLTSDHVHNGIGGQGSCSFWCCRLSQVVGVEHARTAT